MHARAVDPETFTRFWQAYPRRSGSRGKSAARVKFEKLIVSVDPEIIISGARHYAEDEKKNIDTPYIAMAIKWLNQRRWEDYEPDTDKPVLSEEEQERLFAMYRARQEAMR
jgi:hypothetical protein